MDIHEKEQYTCTIRENGKLLSITPIFDPFINTTIKLPRGFKSAWKVFWKGMTYLVHVQGTREAYRVIFKGGLHGN